MRRCEKLILVTVRLGNKKDMSYIMVGMLLIATLKIVVFVLGYLTIKLGKELLVLGVKGEFQFSGKLAGTRADLRSASPGLLFLLLGIALIGYGIAVDKTVLVNEKVYSQELEKLERELDNAPIPSGDKKS